ncbi:hypothetical protein FGB62_81g09 [Gracilaria domingensis]|nr:hypothetical protein FGB62_81g09 [Gracilaria domingensis]
MRRQLRDGHARSDGEQGGEHEKEDREEQERHEEERPGGGVDGVERVGDGLVAAAAAQRGDGGLEIGAQRTEKTGQGGRTAAERVRGKGGGGGEGEGGGGGEGRGGEGGGGVSGGS